VTESLEFVRLGHCSDVFWSRWSEMASRGSFQQNRLSVVLSAWRQPEHKCMHKYTGIYYAYGYHYLAGYGEDFGIQGRKSNTVKLPARPGGS